MSGRGKDIGDLLTRNALRELAWGKSFARGAEYAEDGLVRDLRSTADGVTAKVSGTRTYRVKLWAEGGEIDYDCTCPVGRDGLFCKHCVAVGLAWLEEGGTFADGSDSGEEADLETYLMGLDKRELVSLLLERAGEDDRLFRRLETRSARASASGPDLSVIRGAFDDALETGGFVAWDEMYDLGSGVDDVVDAVEDLLSDGHAVAVIDLAEYCLDAVERAIDHVDDSDGWMGGLLDRLQHLHLEACTEARPDPLELANRLFEMQMESGYGAFHGAAETYKDVLGTTGLAEYRRLAEADWKKVPALGPGDDDPQRYGRRHTITSVMESLARASGDVDGLIAVKSHDLSNPWDFLDVAKVCLEAGREDAALDWAERGFSAFPENKRDGRLREFIASIHHRQGNHDAAMDLTWAAFEDHPSFDMYRVLESHARKADAWPKWRQRALVCIREHLDAQPPAQNNKSRFWSVAPRDGSDLVQIFLHENDAETAWREAQQRGCSDGLWLELAKRREKSHPRDSIAIYRKHIDGLLRHTGNQIYEEVAAYLARIEKLVTGLDGKAAFKPLVLEIRKEQKRKRNLMKLLDEKGW